MLKHKNYFITFICLLGALLSCSKSEDLTPTDSTADFVYSLPQGNAAYDQTIVDLYYKYQTFILYRFTDADFRWSQTSLLAFTATPADAAYVGTAVDYLFQNNLELYGDPLLKKLMPYKILLASTIRSLKANVNSPTLYDTAAVNDGALAVAGFNHLTINNVNSAIVQMSQDRRDSLRAILHCSLWQLALAKDQVEMPDGFGSITDYTATISPTNPYLSGMLYRGRGVSVNAKYDLQYYMQEIARTTEAEFAAKYLIPTVDTSGKIAQKYTILKNYYQEKYGINIHAVGNAH